MIFTIAFRNILRHKRRTILSSITIAVGLTMFIFMDSLIDGTDRGAIDNMLKLSTSSLKITTQKYDQEKSSFPLDYGLGAVAGISTFVKQNDPVKGVAPRTQFMAQLSNYEDMVPVIGTVVDPAADTTVFGMASYIEGSYFSNDNSREILLGYDLAGDLGVKPGDFITLYAFTRYESRNADEFKVAGILKTTNPMINRGSAFITYRAANEFLDLEGLVTELDVSTKGRFDFKNFNKRVGALGDEIRKKYPDLKVGTFEEMSAETLQISKVKRVGGYVFLIFILIIAAVGIFNSVFMSVYERVREIGVLRAHGLRPGQVTLMFLLEGVLTGLFGGVLGLIFGALVNVQLVTAGFPIDKIAQGVDMGEFPLWGTIYGVWNLNTFIFVFIFAVCIATLASVIPARKAGSMEVTRALRFV